MGFIFSSLILSGKKCVSGRERNSEKAAGVVQYCRETVVELVPITLGGLILIMVE